MRLLSAQKNRERNYLFDVNTHLSDAKQLSAVFMFKLD